MAAARTRAALPARPRAAAQHRADRRARLRRPPGARRRPEPRLAGRVQRLHRHARLAAAHAGHDRRPGPAGGGVGRAGRRGAARPSRRRSSDSPPARTARCPAGPGARSCASRACASATGGRTPVLDGFDLRVRPGESVALVGATGSGKTTVARLIPRFYDVEAGADHASTASTSATLRLRDLRRAVGIVFEDTFLFSDTIAANIAFADPDAPHAAIERAARLAGAARVHRRAGRGLRHPHRRAGLLAVGRPAPAHRHRPGHPGRPAGADPRRRHLGGRPHQGARDPRRAHRGHARPHHDRHRPPAGHHRPGRPRGAVDGGPGRRRGHPRRRCSPPTHRYRQVLAAAAGRGDGRRRRWPTARGRQRRTAARRARGGGRR